MLWWEGENAIDLCGLDNRRGPRAWEQRQNFGGLWSGFRVISRGRTG